MQVSIKRSNEDAIIPVRGTKFSAGYDLHCLEDITILPNGKYLADTGISMAIPPDHFGKIYPRSSLALKNHIDVGAGIIDSDYRGKLGVLLFNLSPTDTFKCNKGERIAQLIIQPCVTVDFVEQEELDITERNDGGFGSTGK